MHASAQVMISCNVCQVRQQQCGEVKWACYEDGIGYKIKDSLGKFGTKGSNIENLDRNADKPVANS
jgi:hypothetical protein